MTREDTQQLTDANGYNDKAWPSEVKDDDDDKYGVTAKSKKYFYCYLYFILRQTRIRQRTNDITLQLLVV